MKKIKSSSIRMRLITIPLIVVLIGISAMTAISSYFTRSSIMGEMRVDGLAMSKQISCN